MKKIERIYCEILREYRDKKIMTQKGIARECEVSIGMVNHALNKLQQAGIIEKKQRGFSLLNPKKLLIYWASIRNLSRDIVYSTFSPLSVRKIENSMPPCIFTAYSGYRFLYKTAPADYGEVFVYADEKLIRERFPPNEKSSPNIFVLKRDPYIEKVSTNGMAPPQLIYVDLWNLNTWYADEFLKDFDRRLENGFLE